MSQAKPLHVVLIQPAEPFGQAAIIPQSLIDLAAILREASISVEIIDARLHGLSVRRSIDLLKNMHVDVLGITGLNNAYRYIKDLCIEFKRFRPDTPIMAGGHFILSQPELILPRVPIHVVCTGEGDDIIVELVKRLANKEPLDGINNIAYMNDGQLVRTEFKLVEDFDEKPFPAYDLLDMERYLSAPKPSHWASNYFPITTGRGCVHHCYYCGTAYKKVRRRAPERLLDHMDLLNQRYKVRSFLFSEENSFYPRDWIINFCRTVAKAGRDYDFCVAGCADHVDEEIVQALASVKCSSIGIAVEHWNPNIQKKFFRARQSAHVIKAWDLFKKYGLTNDGFNILWGHPEDSIRDFAATYEKSSQMSREYDIKLFSLAGLVVYPNSRFKEDAIRMQKITDYEDYTYSMAGYGPYVNLTSEDDDRFRGFIRQIQLLNNVQLYRAGIKSLISKDGSKSTSEKPSLPKAVRRLCLSLAGLMIIKSLLRLPVSWRRPFRRLLERILKVPMYDPNTRYYHEISCFKEILSLPKDARIVIYGTSCHSVHDLNMMLNSIDEAQLKLMGFVDASSTVEFISKCSLPVALMSCPGFIDDTSGMRTLLGYPLISVADIGEVVADYLVVLRNTHYGAAIEGISKSRPDLKIVRVDSSERKRLLEHSLTGVFYNDKFWKAQMAGNDFTMELRSE